MSMVNRRNAMIGWATWTLVKQMAARKAKKAVPATDGAKGSKGAKGKRAVKVGAAVAAAAGLIVFWKAKHRDSTDHDSIAAEELGGPQS
jgi:hypothetical protein